ncbi:SRPBCC family protein [Streptomyces sp. Go40/10]|uniref:SRPBCC family protein n=1 Tax=Streptomyces sp. Go40/10 TaxID=2825844 RepID=UPI001E38D8C4|nr:SRPBCC family protein [Streptomyces sp. Go40/10]UFR03696.1 SRPBCC family protein [Streptomyces sp. Go40/10]
MEHQVFLPAPAEQLRTALADQARVARAVPGLQQDAGAEPITGRLKLRVGGHSVTYRGTAHVTPREDGGYAVEADAAEARGTGSVTFSLTLRLTDTEGGCTVTAEGTADATGRIAELPEETVTAAATRLLNRFLEALAANGDEQQTPPADADADADAETDVDADADADAGGDGDAVSGAGTPHPSVFETEVPPPSLDRGFTDTGDPPAEAAHARRTMIGRSAEEVDHAPPRGRYAPVPAPQTVAGSTALRWAAPAAALALASAIVVSRALRRRR